MKTVDIIIPVYQPSTEFVDMLVQLEKQTYPIHKIIITNTEERFFNLLFFGNRYLEQHKNIEVTHISRMEFDHGKTRAEAIERSDADFFVCMTDDAMPKDLTLIERLLEPLLSGKADISYARQLPREDCREIERFTRDFNYPKESRIKSKDDISSLGIKTYFCSNVCAAYNRKVYDELGGFLRHVIFNEDMLFAAKAVNAGHRIAYCADAEVIHSHNFSNRTQFQRNFDLGVSQAQHPEVFETVSSTDEGKKLVRMTQEHLISIEKWYLVPKLYISSAYKFFGYRKGKNYRKLSKKKIKKYTGNRYFWLVDDILNAVMVDPHEGYGVSETVKNK